MKVVYYPDLNDTEKSDGPVRGFTKWLRKKHPDIWALWSKTLEKAEKPGGLDMPKRQEVVGILKHQSCSLFEFRVPKTRSGGVARIYFCRDPNDQERIVLLEAEWKTTTEASTDRLESACGRYRRLFK